MSLKIHKVQAILSIILLCAPFIPLAVSANSVVDTSGGSAPAPAEWVNFSTISYDGSLYVNNYDKGDVANSPFLRQGDPDKYPDQLKVQGYSVDTTGNKTYLPSDNLKATVKVITPGLTGPNTTTLDTTVTSPDKAAITLVWLDTQTLQLVGSGIKFTYDKNQNVYVRSTGETDNCVDTVQASSGATSGTLISRIHKSNGSFSGGLILQDSQRTTKLQQDYLSYPFASYLDYNNTDNNGCWFSKSAPITIGSPPANPHGVGIVGSPSAPSTSSDACASASGAYAWALCPAFDKTKAFLTWSYTNAIQPLLEVTPLTTTIKDPTDKTKTVPNPVFQVWKAFVQLADILFVIAFLVLIFGTTLNLDAYTVKKALPRLVIAAIAVQISFFLCGVLIDVGNIFGDGLQSLIGTAVSPGNTGTFSLANETISNGQKALGAGSAAAITGGLIVTGLLMGPAVIFIIIGFAVAVLTFILTLIVRQLIITILILLAPLAIVAWILPNTESLFKKWRTNFVKVIMVYPIISLLLGVAYIIQAASGDATFVNQIIGGLAPIIVFFLMPKVFKMSGAVMGLAGGAIGKFGDKGNSKLQNSQLKKDTIANSKGKAAQRYMNPETGNFGKARSMLRNGVFLPTGASRRRLATSAAIYSKNQGEEVQNQLDRANGGGGLSIGDLGSGNGTEAKGQLADLVRGNDVGGVKANAISRDRAIAQLAKKSDWGTLRTLQKEQADKYIRQGMNQDVASAKAQTDFTQGLAGSEAFTKARDLVLPREEAFKSVTADGLINMHPSTATAMIDHINTLPAGSAERTIAINSLHAATRGILTDKNLRNKLTASTGKAIFNAAASGVISDPALKTSISTSLNSDGTLI